MLHIPIMLSLEDGISLPLYFSPAHIKHDRQLARSSSLRGLLA